MNEPRPAGWYADPDSTDLQRYWDGTAWTSDTSHRTSTEDATPQPPSEELTGGRRRPRRIIVAVAALALIVVVGGTFAYLHSSGTNWVTAGLDQYQTRDETAYSTFITTRMDASAIDLVSLGDAVCADIRKGTTVVSVGLGLADLTTPANGAVIMAASVKYLCPDQLQGARQQAEDGGFPDQTKELLK